MKKKTIALLLSVTLAAGFMGCGSKSAPAASDVKEARDQTEKTENAEEKAEVEETAAEEKEPEAEEKETKKPSGGVTLGSDQAAGYTGFEYLMEQLVSTTNTKSGDKASFSVYVPDDDYASVYGASANGNRMGVNFQIDMDPYLQYNSQDYTLEENLEYVVENDWDYRADRYYGVSIGEVETTGSDSAVCEVSYVEYSQYSNEYSPYYMIYYIREMDDGITALAELTIDCENTTGKTQAMLDELSSFYEFDINWDSSFAEAKMAEFESSDEYNADAFNLGYMSFELPDGWEKDDSNSTYSVYVFAPEGNAALSETMIVITDEFSTEDAVTSLLYDEDATKAMVEAMFSSAGKIDDITVSDYGNTFLGKTVEIKIQLADESGGDTALLYVGQKDYDIYEIYLMIFGSASAEEKAEGEAALEMLFETANLK